MLDRGDSLAVERPFGSWRGAPLVNWQGRSSWSEAFGLGSRLWDHQCG